MAIEFMRFQSVSSRSARLADYVLREGEYERKRADFSCGKSAGMPTWAKSPHDFFLEAEKQEHGEIGKHVVIALPKEFSYRENSELAEELVHELFPSHTYVWGIHVNNGTLSNEENPHLHILVCDRKIEPDRKEPPRETYFKKSRTLKNGEISGGYRKDDFLSGSQRQKGLLLKKKLLEKIMNEHIEKHNQKTGENVRKIDFEERHGKGSKHIGKNAIAVGLKKRSKIIQNELDRRIKKITDETEKSVKEKLDKNGGKLDLWSKGEVLVTRIFKGKERAKSKEEYLKIVFSENPYDLRQEISAVRASGGERATATANGFNDGLKQTAGERNIEKKITYQAKLTPDLNRELWAKKKIEQEQREEEIGRRMRDEQRKREEEKRRREAEEEEREKEERRKYWEWEQKRRNEEMAKKPKIEKKRSKGFER